MSNVAELIQKLLALSKSPNEHEAALAMAKAQELLLKHNLDMAAITAPTQEETDEAGMINEVIDFDDFEKWQGHLVNSVAIRNFCKVIVCGSEYHILGRKANVKAVETMYNWLEPQIIRLIAASGYKRGEKNSYALGIISTISRKLEESKEQYQTQNPTSRALVVNVQKEIDVWYREQYQSVSTRRSSTVYGGAFSRGQSDGRNVSVYGSSRQVSGSRLLLN